MNLKRFFHILFVTCIVAIAVALLIIDLHKLFEFTLYALRS